MKFLKSHFALTRSQQTGIFVLVILIVLFQIIIFTWSFFRVEPPENSSQRQLEKYRHQLDSINKSEPEIVKDTIYPFNPNYITDFKGYQLGLNVEEIDRIFKYRKENKWINSSEDFQQVTGISDSILNKISPYFRFPEWTQKINSVKSENLEKNTPIGVLADLNSATAQDLKSINGVGEILSERIVKYRFKIGGFLSVLQLKDVYGLSAEVVHNILQKFQILTKPEFSVINLNTATVMQLSEIPYFNYELAREIVSYRKLHEKIVSFDELSKIDTFPSDKIDRIKLYLAIE